MSDPPQIDRRAEAWDLPFPCPHPVRAVAGEEYEIPTVVGQCLACGDLPSA